MMRLILSTVTVGLLSVSASMAATTKLPASAKQLTKAEIVAAYDGKTYKWVRTVGKKGHGTTKYDAKTETVEGTFNVGANSGEFEGKISWKGDAYCFSTTGKGMNNWGPVTCHYIYSDGTTIYETDTEKKRTVESINTPM